MPAVGPDEVVDGLVSCSPHMKARAGGSLATEDAEPSDARATNSELCFTKQFGSTARTPRHTPMMIVEQAEPNDDGK